jgi:hypothetical protein
MKDLKDPEGFLAFSGPFFKKYVYVTFDVSLLRE